MANKYSEIVKSTIEDFVKNDWKSKFFDYVSESDIRSCLYCKIRSKLPEGKIQLKVQQCGTQDAFDDQKTIRVHCEMAIPNNHNRHLDIGIWSKQGSENIDDYKDFPVFIGVEIKYYWVRKLYAVVIDGIVGDIDKLLDASESVCKKILEEPFKGYILTFLPRIDIDNVDNAKTEIKNRIEEKMERRRSEFGNIIEIYPIFAQNNSLRPLLLFQ